jgi:hypothetical protein
MENEKLILYHGSSHIVQRPVFGEGNPHNDYGSAFYCTENIELAKEWACIKKDGGYVNRYILHKENMNTLYLSSSNYNILNWLAVLLANRTFDISSGLAVQAKAYLLEHFLPEQSAADLIVGYRADDSYFAFAEDFLSGAISLRQLSEAMHLGKLGEQIALKSAKAFDLIEFDVAISVDGAVYYAKRMARDKAARTEYLQGIRGAASLKNELFIVDILREEVRDGDARLQ